VATCLDWDRAEVENRTWKGAGIGGDGGEVDEYRVWERGEDGLILVDILLIGEGGEIAAGGEARFDRKGAII
jgi:hypothetical protein